MHWLPISTSYIHVRRRLVTMRATLIRRLAAKMTETERSEALREANAKMREYAMNRPPIEKVKRKRKANSEHTLQMALAASFVTVFLATPLLGRKIAQDEEFKKKYVPAFYDFTLEKPANPWTRKELHEQLVALQAELHEKAIAGEFTPEKLEEMRRHFAGVDVNNDPHGWGKLHPGVDDDEDLEDD